MDLKALEAMIRDVPDFPKPGILFKDITPLLQDGAAFAAVIDLFAERYRDRGIEQVVGVEARGFVFAAALAKTIGAGLALVRKPGKLPYQTISERYALEYGTDCLELHEDAFAQHQRALIVDDLLATGGTAAATAALVEKAGGQVVEIAFLIELAFLQGRQRLAQYPVQSWLVY